MTKLIDVTKGGYHVIDDGDGFFIPHDTKKFFHRCCECKTMHKVGVSFGDEGVTLFWSQLDEDQEAGAFSEADKKEPPASTGGSRAGREGGG